MTWKWKFMLFLSCVTWQVTTARTNSITTRLVAPWAPTSALHEAAEYLNQLHPNFYWNFMDTLLDKLRHFPAPTTAKAERDLASVIAYNFISSSRLRMMDWALTARAQSPKVLSLQQLAPENVPVECKDAFVTVGSKTSCKLEEIEQLLGRGGDGLSPGPVLTDDDHKFPSLVWSQMAEPSTAPLVAILYGDLKSSQTRDFHQLLKKWSDRVGYVFRPYEQKSQEAGKLLLSGYGIELQFKSTEYKAQDDSTNEEGAGREVGGFLFDKLVELYPENSEDLGKFQNYLATQKSSTSEFEALKAWQVQELGLQASYYTTTKDDLLEALKDVSGNFPSRAASLSSLRVLSDFKKAVAHNQRLLASHFNLDEGEGAFFLQGSYIDPDALDLFSFMQSIQEELEFMELLRSLRQDRPQVTRAEVDKILSLGTKSQAEPELALDLRDSSIFWINDLEKDEEYEDWPDDLTQLFFRMGGIMLRPVRRNVFNLVLSVNPTDVGVTGALLKMAHSFMAHKSPVRIGVVFCSGPDSESDTKSSLIRRLMNYAATEGKIRPVFHDIVNAYAADDFSKLQAKWGSLAAEEFDFGADLACDFVRRSGRPTPGAFLNGVPLKWDSVDDFEEVVLNQLLREAQAVQIEAYNGRVNEDTDIFDYLMNKPHVLTRLNDKILDTTNSKSFSFGTESWSDLGKQFRDPLANIANSIVYLQPTGKKTLPVTVTMWLFSDLETSEGREFLLKAVEFFVESATHTRIAFISSAENLSTLTTDVNDAFINGDVKAIKRMLSSEAFEPNSGTVENVAGKELMKQLGLSHGDRGVLVNGRLIGPLPADEKFQLGDWALIQKYSYDSCPKHVEDEDWNADSVMRLCAALSSPTFKKTSKRFVLPDFQNPYVVGKQRPGSEKEGATQDVFFVDLTAVIDPASRHAHKMAALLSAVEQKVGEWIQSRVIFNPPSKHSELPLKSYYRYVAGTETDESVAFDDIPRDPLFTQNIAAPDNWMVEVVKCEKDLDNIRLKDLGTESVDSVYELEHLLVEGHCLESKSGSPPRGLQFTLTPHNPNVRQAETIVMANLGYFQLKASPGLWSLDLREGPSREIFALENTKQSKVSVNSFQSVVIKVKVRRNPGKETASLLDTEEESSSWFGFGSKNKKDAEEDTINVFSVASGHLYERVLRIMMLSVLKNTQSKVKFWFLKNYLSPTLKDLLPEMAKEYGFEYELVQYHWPRWLNPQREKQRIIWGYKILFLDVLFPLSLKKIVFVDADLVVRADLKELFDLDLEGNPYGYTPFCDSRTEMEGFRFWKHGYWKSHLGRRKYHISALYVVDLLRFRRVAAGDRLRGQYQALSQDPNSLSNLDQDLPNNMIHQVGIKSLPQEWLWCETWCDDASKEKAKTIDLCNNPQTKEPKLDAAQRIVPEWKDYDQEIRQFQQRLRNKGQSQQEANNAKVHEEHAEL